MGQVATVRTVLTNAEALAAFRAAGCPESALLMVAAQSAFETAHWQSMHNWNMGNITPTAAQAASGDWMSQGLPMKYISYSSPVAGAQGMLQWLQAHGLLTYAVNGDLGGYVAQLKADCYMGCVGATDPTGHLVSDTDYDNLEAAMVSWMGILAQTPAAAPVAAAAPSSGLLGAFFGILFGTALGVAANAWGRR